MYMLNRLRLLKKIPVAKTDIIEKLGEVAQIIAFSEIYEKLRGFDMTSFGIFRAKPDGRQP